MAWRRCSSRRKASSGATSPLTFSSMRCRRTNGSRTSSRGFSRGDGLLETCAVGLEIEAQAGRGDHLDVEFGETDAGGGTDALEAATDDVQSVFGGIEQDAAGTATAKRRRQGMPAATATARSRARKDLQHLGSPPMMPTASSDHSPSTSQRCCSGHRRDARPAGPEAGSSPASDRRLGLARGGHGAGLEEQRLVDLAGVTLCGDAQAARPP